MMFINTVNIDLCGRFSLLRKTELACMRLRILSKAFQTNFFLLLFEVQINTFVSIPHVKFTVLLHCYVFPLMSRTEKWSSQGVLFASELSKHSQREGEKKYFVKICPYSIRHTTVGACLFTYSSLQPPKKDGLQTVMISSN